METREYRTIDKSTWGPGPWQDEPDKRQWENQPTGLPCLIVRGPAGALCGYVGIPKGHPYYGRHYDEVPVEAHGGLTFGDYCRVDSPEDSSICHVPGPGEPDDVYWLGFDCAHAGDVSPATDALIRQRYDPQEWANRMQVFAGYVYRDVAYVTAEVDALAVQLAGLASRASGGPFGAA